MNKKEILNSLPNGWFKNEAMKASSLHKELQKELPKGHILYNVPVNVIAYREGTDDILCQHEKNALRFTVIHLSWIGKEEINEEYPSVEVDGNFQDFINYENKFLKK